MRKRRYKGESKYLGKILTHKKGMIEIIALHSDFVIGKQNFVVEVINHLHTKLKLGDQYELTGSTIRKLYKEQNNGEVA